MDTVFLDPAEAWQWNYVVSVIATAAFAATGVLAITKGHDCDLLSAVVFGVIAGLGGGTLRDLILQRPPAWSHDQSLVAVAAGTALVAFYLQRQLIRRTIYAVLNYLDGFGAAMFAVQSTGLVWHVGFARPSGPIALGVLTGIGGGLIRDVLAGRRTLLMRRELYATPIVLGCVASSIILRLAPGSWKLGSLGCIVATFGLRAAALHWGLTLPRWATSKTQRGGRGAAGGAS
jgi:uncharacterized membrane protein YeiH